MEPVNYELQYLKNIEKDFLGDTQEGFRTCELTDDGHICEIIYNLEHHEYQIGQYYSLLKHGLGLLTLLDKVSVKIPEEPSLNFSPNRSCSQKPGKTELDATIKLINDFNKLYLPKSSQGTSGSPVDRAYQLLVDAGQSASAFFQSASQSTGAQQTEQSLKNPMGDN